MNRADALTSLERLASECSREGWDGYGAEPVRLGTVAHAGRFLDALPKQFPVPAPGMEPDGCVTMEWYASSDWIVSVSLSPACRLDYAAILGKRKKYGSCVFADAIPTTVLDLIKQFCTKVD
jgi:hypothetical protein